FEETAEEIARTLQANLAGGDYDGIATTEGFADRLTADMAAVAGDKHLWVKVPPERELRIARGEIPPDEEGDGAGAAYGNFGFRKLERLEHNIGYLELTGFQEAARARETAVAAMNFLANADALVIDLRQNGGGDPSMIQLLASYFFAEPVWLNSFYIRETDETRQFWTQAQVAGKRLADTPLFVLTSPYTFSAAEEFAYDLKNLDRAVVIGETTGGGAHPNRIEIFSELGVAVSVPFGRAINPVTGTNWEGTGVEPDVACAAGEALDVARIAALEVVRKLHPEDRERGRRIAFSLDRLQALHEPAAVPREVLDRWTGTYGPRRLFLRDGELWYQREGNPEHRATPMSPSRFCFADLEYFTLEVEVDANGNPTALVGHYSDGRTDRNERG
ncbi:MAG: S41 family peptidase, partial [Acidobacteriota bacterium]